MGWIMGSQNIMGLDYGSNISADVPYSPQNPPSTSLDSHFFSNLEELQSF